MRSGGITVEGGGSLSIFTPTTAKGTLAISRLVGNENIHGGIGKKRETSKKEESLNLQSSSIFEVFNF